LNTTKKVGIAKVMIHTRQYLAALIPHDQALVLNILRYHQELRKASEFELPDKNIKVSAKEKEIAKQLVESMTTKWNPNDYEDEFKIALQGWIEEKVTHETSKSPKKMKEVSAKKTNVINFVDLLKKSIKNQKQTAPKKISRAAAPRATKVKKVKVKRKK
jgi:DNA end-binding protein Ku